MIYSRSNSPAGGGRGKPFPELIFLAITLLLSACASPAAPGPGRSTTLNAFAAASLADSFEQTGEAFEQANPGVEVVFNFAGSQQLAQQLTQGAPADVFASANQKHMQVVIADGRIASGTDQPFAHNQLVVIVPRENPAGIGSLEDLARDGLRLVFAAAEVPVGQYSLEFLDKATQEAALGQGFKESVLENVVSYEDSVKAVLSKVALGEADGGIVYTSDVSGESAGQVRQIIIPEELNVLATYPIAPVADSPHPDLAEAFIDFVISQEGQRILAEAGFKTVAETR